jgi:hypothetical protein
MLDGALILPFDFIGFPSKVLFKIPIIYAKNDINLLFLSRSALIA